MEEPMKILRIDVSKKEVHFDAVPEIYSRLGGRALIA
jgi:hypothetical protein